MPGGNTSTCQAGWCLSQHACRPWCLQNADFIPNTWWASGYASNVRAEPPGRESMATVISSPTTWTNQPSEFSRWGPTSFLGTAPIPAANQFDENIFSQQGAFIVADFAGARVSPPFSAPDSLQTKPGGLATPPIFCRGNSRRPRPR